MVDAYPDLGPVVQALLNKVDKEDGKGLSTEDFTSELLHKLDRLKEVEANPTGEPTETLGKIKIGETIYTAPQGPQGEPGEDGQDGQPGAPGPANTLTIGTVTDGEQAAASITGDAPNQTLNLVLPKGEKGDAGENAVNPFKGWFTTANIPTTGQEGDYCNVTDTQTQTVTIYRWNTTTNQFEDTGEVPDTATGETFASGETLQQVAIDDSHLVNPVNTADSTQPLLSRAEDVLQLKAKLEGVTASEEKGSTILDYNGYIVCKTGSSSTEKTYKYDASVHTVFIPIPQDAKKLRFLGRVVNGNNYTTGYAFINAESQQDIEDNIIVSSGGSAKDISNYIVELYPWENKGINEIIEISDVVIPTGATYFCAVYGTGSITQSNFYCYLQSGESVSEMIPEIVDNLDSTASDKSLSANQGRVLDDKINEIEYPEYIQINLDSYTVVTQGTIRYSTNVWDNYSFQYNKCIFIPINPGDKVEILGTNQQQNVGSQFAFLTTNEITIDETPSYAGSTSLKFAAYNTLVSDIAPEGSVWLYVLFQQNDNNTGTSINNRKPQYIKVSSPLPYVKESDIVTTLDSTDETTVLSGALGPVLKPSVEAGKPINRISPLGGQKVQGANLYYADGAWNLGTGRSCTFVDIQGLGIKKIQVVAGNHSAHFGFVSDFIVPENGVEGLENTYASIIGNIYTLAANTSVDRDVPSEAKFIYFNISGEKQDSGYCQTYCPKEVNILEQESNIEPIIPSWDNNYDYETYVEENYYDEQKTHTYTKQKFYKIDHNAEYKLLLFGTGVWGSSSYGITTYDSSYNVKRNLYPWGNGTSQNVNMDDLVFQEGETYARLFYYHYTASGAYGPNALGALMRKLKNDNWVPTNNLIYCVSKIKSPVMPYNYQEADTVFPQTDEWSAWDFVMPYNYNRVLFTNKKFPICAFFHGSSGWDSPDNMGYGSSERIMYDSTGKTIVGMLREAGYVVFDINGYGISRAADDKSRHWGNPRAVSTVKKAYEVLVDRFNCRRGMAISGISMAGAIAKSYCMTYPGDVVCAAMEAPSELGGTCRFSVSGAHDEGTSQTSAAHAWGYENAIAMYADNEHTAFIGYSPCIAPNIIDENGFIKKIVQTDWNEQSDIFSNLSNFSCNFPVEIKIWHGDADVNVPLEYNQWFVNTVRNANGNATLRLCPNCTHDLNNYPWVRQEIINYIDSKMKL